MLAFALHAVLVFAPPPSRVVWTWHLARPDDPALSCYQHANATWACAPDALLAHETHPEDSY